MTSAVQSKTKGDAAEGKLDLRQQLYNEQLVGPAAMIQLPAAAITSVHGILLDFDPKLIRPDNLLFPFAEDPREFFHGIQPVLARHPLTRQAEVLNTGTGIHAIPRFHPAVELRSAAEQRRFATLVRAVQCSLPADPRAPGVTGLTRAVGSINSKNGATVEVLRAGEPIDPEAVEAFVRGLLEAPFRTIATILLGDDRVLPCPVCRGEGSRLDVLERCGKCYARCGDVNLTMLLDCIFKPFEPAPQPGGGEAVRSTSPRRREPRPTAKKSASK
jgi:hypothetical protein